MTTCSTFVCGSRSNSPARPSSSSSCSVEGCTVSPRKSRRKSACFSSTVTSTPARASSRPSTMPAGPPPTTRQGVRSSLAGLPRRWPPCRPIPPPRRARAPRVRAPGLAVRRPSTELRGDLDGSLQAPCHRAALGVDGEHPLDLLGVAVRDVQPGVRHRDPLEHQDLALELHLTARVPHQTGGVDPPGTQGPGERPGELTERRADDVV